MGTRSLWLCSLSPALRRLQKQNGSCRAASPLASLSGSLGTLIGADLLNLDKRHGLGAPMASLGGAGTFDGSFLTGILAVLLA